MNSPARPGRDSYGSSDEFSVEVVRVESLSDEDVNIWSRIRASSPDFASPYYDIEFTRAVSRVRKDVFVGVLRNVPGEIIAFFPFQRLAMGHGEPVGGMMNDVHGVMGYGPYMFDLREVTSSCGMRSFKFHALNTTKSFADDFEFERPGAYYVDLKDGWDAYHAWARKNSRTVKKQGQKTRALERAFGPIRFEFDCVDPDALEKLIALKRAKYVRAKTFDILSVKWAANLLREIHQVSGDEFQGLLSCLWAGDRLIAGHFGMLSGDVLHYWFPTFDVEFSRYSPGTEMILQVCETAASKGINVVDFGYGDDEYKFKFCNATRELSCGMVRKSRAAFFLDKQKYILRRKLKKIPMKDSLKVVLRGVFPKFGQWNFK